MTGIPITNVNNNCSTGSTALYQANQLVKGGLVECALALGFERMRPGSLGTNFPDRPSPTILFNSASIETESTLSAGLNHGPGAPRIFANAGQEYSDKYGSTIEHLAMIGQSRIFFYLGKTQPFNQDDFD
jgi:sterol carrier protein 2